MQRQPVNSTSLASVGYDSRTKTLEVEFLESRKVYEYYDVPLRLYEGLLEAPSLGTFFNAEIRNGGYAYKRL